MTQDKQRNGDTIVDEMESKNATIKDLVDVSDRLASLLEKQHSHVLDNVREIEKSVRREVKGYKASADSWADRLLRRAADSSNSWLWVVGLPLAGFALGALVFGL